MVHGNCLSVGCYAMTDKGIEEIWLLVDSALKNGQQTFPVHAFPFRMNDENMAFYDGHPWFEFWQELKPGYDAFEQSHVPPQVSVVDGHYQIEPAANN